MQDIFSKEKEPLLSVSEFIALINDVISKYKFNVQGEISEFTDRGNTVFFTIADTQNEATLSCLIWKSRYRALGIELEEGMEVKINGSPNIYTRTGRFSFIADTITPLGEGALRKAFEILKKKLEEKGYFDPETKLIVPDYAQTIGLITADKSDAKKDFETHIGDFGYKVYFHDVRVEGANSMDSIVEAFRWFNESPVKFDVLVLTRGGGSLENLQSFNSEGVAKAIYSSKIPVISAVGHENDITIADLVADVRVSTPTHAGKFLAQPWINAEEQIDTVEKSVSYFFDRYLKELTVSIEQLEQSLITSFESKLYKLKQILANIELTQTLSFKNVINTYKAIEQAFSHNLSKFDFALRTVLNKLDNTYSLLLASDPRLKLKQGYSISKDKYGKIIKSTKQLKAGDILITELAAGEILSTVTNLKE